VTVTLACLADVGPTPAPTIGLYIDSGELKVTVYGIHGELQFVPAPPVRLMPNHHPVDASILSSIDVDLVSH
jgi:hypothetical protein